MLWVHLPLTVPYMYSLKFYLWTPSAFIPETLVTLGDLNHSKGFHHPLYPNGSLDLFKKKKKRNFFFMFIFECVSRGGAGRVGDRIGSRLHAVSAKPDVGPKPTNCEIMTRAEVTLPTD